MELYRARAGRDPRLVIYSLPVQEMCRAMKEGDLESAARLLAGAIDALRAAGAQAVILAANTPHAALRRLQGVGVQVIDIVEPVLNAIREIGASKVGLLATAATIKYRVYHEVLEDEGIEVVTPSQAHQAALDRMVERLTEGKMREGDRLLLAQLYNHLEALGAEAIIHGCTELSLLAGNVKTKTPVVDSLTEHAKAAADWLLSQ